MSQGSTVPKTAFHRTLLGRSMLFGVLPAVAVLMLAFGINGYRAWSRSTDALDADLRHAAELIVQRIDALNQRNIRLAQLMATAQESGQFGRRAESLRWMEKIMRDNPQAYGAGIAYEPNADGNDAAGAVDGVPANALGPGGRMYAYLKRDAKSPSGLRLEPLQDTEEDGELWYGFPKQRFERSGVRDPVITKPYTYLGTDIIENVAPIIIDGRFKGIMSLDITLGEVQGTLLEEARRLDADLFLVTRGLFIAATSDERGGTALRTTPVAESSLAPVFKVAEVNLGASWLGEDPMLREECFYVAGKVPTGEWTLLLRKPTSQVTQDIAQVVFWNLATGFAGIVVLVVVLWFGAAAIARRVRTAMAMAGRIAGGDLAGDAVEARGSDESAELIRAMNDMGVQLQAIVGAVRGACTRLAATSAQLAATSQEQRATVGSFGESTAQIAAAIREIAATGTELLRAVESIDAGARRTAESALAGRARLDAVSGAMTRLDAGTREISDRLATIAEKAAAISTVVTTIGKVAEQTNLLSVNAAIEAEKAGDAGVGFLVVAREIRRLADQTAGASHDIARIVAQMQSSVSAGVADMNRFAGEMKQGTGDVQAIAGELGEIITEIEASAASFSDVRTGMSSQSQGVGQIEQAVVQVAAGARQSATAAQEFGRVADELAHAVAVLQDAAARFRLREDQQP